MKSKFAFLTLTTALLTAILFAGCLKDDCKTTKTYIRLDPVYKTTTEIRSSITAEPPRAMKHPGKLYYFQNYLLINELREGIHVFDNADPANPKPLVFWKIDGNVDMAIRGNHLYADQYVDLVTLDISDLQRPQVACRVENVFQLYGFDAYRGWLVEYVPTSVTETIDCNDNRFNGNWWRDQAGGGGIFVSDAFFSSNSKDFTGPVFSSNGAGAAAAAATGLSGSFARFCIKDEHLYAIDNSTLYPFGLTNPACPEKGLPLALGWNIETIFPWKNRLFIGSQNGVFILNNTDPARPVFESSFSHATGCDPVVCDDNFAFVTIHDGTTCNASGINQLDVLGISALPAVGLLKSYPMKRPLGLSLAGNLLFLCDDGLKIFDRSDIDNLRLLSHQSGIKAWDAIALGTGLLLVIGDDGFYQFDTSDPANPKQISHLPVQL